MSRNTNNMTEGNIIKQLFTFFLPLLAGNLFQQAYSMVDSIIVGKGIGDDALAAVGSTGVVNFLLLGFIFGLTGGFGIHMSQSFGANDLKRLKHQIVTAAMLSFVLGAVSTVLCLFVIRPVFNLVHTPADIIEDALSYFRIILYGILISLFCNLSYTILRAVGNSRTPLVATVISSIINIVLDYILVIPLDMGVQGAAIATIASQAVSGLVCLYTILRIDAIRITKEDFRFEPEHARRMLGTGLPVALMNGVTAGGCLILQNIINNMGSAYVACYSACMRLNNVFEQVGISVGITLLTFVGQNKGAGKLDRVRQGLNKGLLLGAAVNIPIAAVSIFLPKLLVSIMLSEPETIAYSTQFMPITGFGMFALSMLFAYRHSLQGLGNTVLPMFSGIIEVGCRYVFGMLCGTRGFWGIAVAEISAWVGAGLFLMVSFYYELHKQEKIQRLSIDNK